MIELARNPDVQTKPRNELLAQSADPAYDQLANGFPYLDAVVHETLRIHLPIVEVTRVVRTSLLPRHPPGLSCLHHQCPMIDNAPVE